MSITLDNYGKLLKFRHASTENQTNRTSAPPF